MKNIKVSYEQGAAELAERLIGRPVSDEELAAAVGAFGVAEVTIHPRLDGGLLADIKHPEIELQQRRIFRNALGELEVNNLYCTEPRPRQVELGRHIVSDPEICGGDLTFKGTRILVKDVLDTVAKGWDWDKISEVWDRRISREAIAEAVALANEALAEKTEQRWLRAA